MKIWGVNWKSQGCHTSLLAQIIHIRYALGRSLVLPGYKTIHTPRSPYSKFIITHFNFHIWAPREASYKSHHRAEQIGNIKSEREGLDLCGIQIDTSWALTRRVRKRRMLSRATETRVHRIEVWKIILGERDELSRESQRAFSFWCFKAPCWKMIYLKDRANARAWIPAGPTKCSSLLSSRSTNTIHETYIYI